MDGYGWNEVGSAPWIRGTLTIKINTDTFTRFSPVDTGNTPESAITETVLPVQPRGYGEHNHLRLIKWNVQGSAPWIRGTLDNSFTL